MRFSLALLLPLALLVSPGACLHTGPLNAATDGGPRELDWPRLVPEAEAGNIGQQERRYTNRYDGNPWLREQPAERLGANEITETPTPSSTPSPSPTPLSRPLSSPSSSPSPLLFSSTSPSLAEIQPSPSSSPSSSSSPTSTPSLSSSVEPAASTNATDEDASPSEAPPRRPVMSALRWLLSFLRVRRPQPREAV